MASVSRSGPSQDQPSEQAGRCSPSQSTTSRNDDKNKSNSPRELSEILAVYPRDKTCIGSAPSKKRGCKKSTKANNRALAYKILNEGTDRLHDGQSLSGLLVSLAPLLLCNIHKNQAPGIVEEWERVVRLSRAQESQESLEERRSDDERRRLIAALTTMLQERQLTNARPPTRLTPIPQLQISGSSSSGDRSPITTSAAKEQGNQREDRHENSGQRAIEPKETDQALATTEHAVAKADPQTPTKVEFRLILNEDKPDMGDAFSSRESTPLETPEGREVSIFSQQNSVGTDVTNDYGWDSPDLENSITLQNDLLASPTPNTRRGGEKRELMRLVREPLTTGVGPSQNLVLRRTKSASCLNPERKVPSSDLDSDLEEQDGRHIACPWPNIWLQDTNPKLEKLDNQRPQGIITFRKVKSVGCLNTVQKTPKRKFSSHDKFSIQTLRLTDIYLQLKGSGTNSEARYLKKPRLSGQGLSTPKGEKLRSRDSPILRSDCIDTNFGKTGWVPLPQASPYSGVAASSVDPPKILTDAEATSELVAKIFGSDIDRRLADSKVCCVASKKTGDLGRCSKQHKGNIQEAADSLKSLKTARFGGTPQWIEILIGSSLCKQHRKIAKEQLDKWHVYFGNLLQTQSNKSGDQLTTDSSASRKKKESIPATCKVETEDAPPAAISPPIPKLQVFTPWFPGYQRGKPISRLLETLINKPISKSRKKRKDKGKEKGLMYIYWQPGNFGHVKIGRTVDIGDRLKRWEAQCGKPLGVYFPQDEQDMIPVEHISRVETLVQMELRDQRRKEAKCSGCKKLHIEWFEVSRVIAEEIVRKWMRWMYQRPYEEIPAGSGEWHFKGETGALAALCQPHSGLTPPPPININPKKVADKRLSETISHCFQDPE